MAGSGGGCYFGFGSHEQPRILRSWDCVDGPVPRKSGIVVRLWTGAVRWAGHIPDAAARRAQGGEVFRLGRGDSGKLQDELVFRFELSFRGSDALLQLRDSKVARSALSSTVSHHTLDCKSS